MMMRFLIVIGLCSVLSIVSVSQESRCYAELDTAQVLLSQPFDIQVSLLVSKDSAIVYPQRDEGFLSEFECIEYGTIDTTEVSEQEMELHFKYRLARFNPGSVSFRAGPYVTENSDTIWSNNVQLEVVMPEVDTAAAIKPIKSVKRPEYTWHDWLPRLLWIALIVVAVLAAIWALIKYGPLLRKRFIKPEKIIEEAPEEVALRSLNELEQKQLWSFNQSKLHYTELTDILRTYFEHKLGIQVFEKTSDEMMHIVASTGKVAPALLDDLRMLLAESDFVKFAKHKPEIATIHKHIAIVRALILDVKNKTSIDNTDEV
ncbi:MAG: hypothetical protein R6U95_09795 [Bacteroidales bacterium]